MATLFIEGNDKQNRYIIQYSWFLIENVWVRTVISIFTCRRSVKILHFTFTWCSWGQTGVVWPLRRPVWYQYQRLLVFNKRLARTHRMSRLRPPHQPQNVSRNDDQYQNWEIAVIKTPLCAFELCFHVFPWFASRVGVVDYNWVLVVILGTAGTFLNYWSI